MSLNRIHLLGMALKRQELRYLTSGSAVLNAKLLVSKTYTDRGGVEQRTETEVPLTLWGKHAEQYANEVAEGAPLYVEGELTNRKRRNEKTGGEFDNVSVSVSVWRLLTAAAAGASARTPAAPVQRERPAPHKLDQEEDDLPF